MSASPGSALVVVENLSVPFDRRVWQECVALRDAGYEVTVICPRGHTQDREPLEVLDGVEIHRYPLAPATGGVAGYALEYGAALRHTRRLARRLARRRRFNVVHVCNPPDLMFLALRFLKRRGAACVFDHHDLVPELYLSRFGRGEDLLYRGTLLLERLTFRWADVVLATNESYRAAAVGRGGKDPADVFVVRSAPDASRFMPREPDPSLRRGRAHLVAYLGVMGPQDGIDHALRALAALSRRRSDWHAVFVGDGDVRPGMEGLARELGLGGAVEFTGRIPDEDVVRILSTADVCLAPDPKNPLNDVSTMNKVVEYMALGRPLVSYDLVESRVSAGDAALYARPNEPDDLARCVDELLDDPEKRREMGRIGRARVAEELSWERSTLSLLAAYDRALCLPPRREAQVPAAA